MNICDDRHEPKYQIIYKSAKGRNYAPVWLVCENCLENQEHFGSEDQIEVMGILIGLKEK